MRDTTQENIVFKKWLETEVFSIADVFISGVFDKSKVLYQGASYKEFFLIDKNAELLNSAIHKAGFKAFWDNEAKWFDVNVNEDKPKIEGIGWYSYNEPFEYIFSILNNPTPNTYAGIGSATNKWMLLVHGETVSIHGSAEFLDYVSESMGDC